MWQSVCKKAALTFGLVYGLYAIFCEYIQINICSSLSYSNCLNVLV